MKLEAYLINAYFFDLVPAPVERAWMDTTHQRYAYRCLPLSIANAHGWELRCTNGFNAIWNGGDGLDAIMIIPDPGTSAHPISHFGHGILTFHVPCLFRTEANIDLMVQGPINYLKDGISPLSGIVETDWAPFTFTMNWKFTRPNISIRFEKGEPYCLIFPLRRGELENVDPELLSLSDDPELERQYKDWTNDRNRFNAELKQLGSGAQAEKWQKNYHRGLDPSGREMQSVDHRTRLRLKPFQRKTE